LFSLFRIGLAAALVVCANGASAQDIACRVTQKPMVVADLMFGRNIGGRLGVTERRWSHFLASEITPRFPDGLTVVDASGQWRDTEKNRVVRERSKLVTIVMPADAQEKLDAIVDAYKRRFRQQSVGVVIRSACVSF
jgi:Protein of unknown function (DUF3574)